MRPRRFGEDLYLMLKARWGQLVREAGGTEFAAELTNSYKSRISEYGARQHMDKFPSIDKIVDLELDSGLPIITRALADLHGMDLVQREAHASVGIHAHFARIVREARDVEIKMAEAMADGTITDQERAEISKEASEAITALQAMLAEFRTKGLKIVGGQ